MALETAQPKLIEHNPNPFRQKKLKKELVNLQTTEQLSIIVKAV